MSKFAVGMCSLFAAVCAVIEARECYYEFTWVACEKQCCGKEEGLYCLDTCENITCSSDEQCGTSCCENGKCGKKNCSPPTNSPQREQMERIVILIIGAFSLGTLIVAIAVLICYRSRRPAAAPEGMRVTLVNHDALNANI